MISEIAKRPTLRVQNFSNLGRRANKRVFSASFLMLIITAAVATLFGHPKRDFQCEYLREFRNDSCSNVRAFLSMIYTHPQHLLSITIDWKNSLGGARSAISTTSKEN